MSDNRCIFCGEHIPEGSMVCPICEKRYDGDEKLLKDIIKSQKTFKRMDKFNDILNNWIIPLGLLAFFIYLCFVCK